MTAVTATNYLEIIEHLTPGEPAVFHDVSWEDYEQLSDELVDRSGVHLSYNEGTLENDAEETDDDNRLLQDYVEIVSS
ncbi:MAG: hypothetical protein ACREEM_13360 [Blastocatellia bacterium]